MIKEGYYDHSTALEAVETKKTITAIIKMRNGKELLSTSVPILDEKGDVMFVVTSSRDQNMLESLMSKLMEEKAKTKRYRNEVEYLRSRNETGIIAVSEAMVQILMEVDKIAPTDSTVMIYGESGTGKDVIANYIHRRSKRAKEAFISINCAAIPENLLESELFGYEKGSFTGASNKGKPGLFEIGDKGTVFLDEIAELPLSLQPKLLRVLESGEIRRIGGTNTRKVDVRVIGATNRDLRKMIADNSFREDLFYRLNVLPITIPPLRERPEDIPALADKFLKELNEKYGQNKRFATSTVNAFLDYFWPGNVRELRNVVERAYVISPGPEIIWRHDFKYHLETHTATREGGQPSKAIFLPENATLKEFVDDAEQAYIAHVLKACNGNIGETAKRLGIHRSVLYRKLHKKKQEE